MKTETEVRQSLRDWIVKTNGKIRAEDLADDTPIIDRRIISSLQLMDLILMLERLSGNPIDAETARRQIELPIVARPQSGLPWQAPHLVDAVLALVALGLPA